MVKVDSGALVRWIRTITQYSQRDIAILCELKPESRTLVSMWETGEREPTERQWKILLQLAPLLAHSHADSRLNTFLSV